MSRSRRSPVVWWSTSFRAQSTIGPPYYGQCRKQGTSFGTARSQLSAQARLLSGSFQKTTHGTGYDKKIFRGLRKPLVFDLHGSWFEPADAPGRPYASPHERRSRSAQRGRDRQSWELRDRSSTGRLLRNRGQHHSKRLNIRREPGIRPRGGGDGPWRPWYRTTIWRCCG